MKEKTFEFKGGYNRIGIIRFGKIEECAVCKEKDVEGLGIDFSEEEYGEGQICFKCIDKNKE